MYIVQRLTVVRAIGKIISDVTLPARAFDQVAHLEIEAAAVGFFYFFVRHGHILALITCAEFSFIFGAFNPSSEYRFVASNRKMINITPCASQGYFRVGKNMH